MKRIVAIIFAVVMTAAVASADTGVIDQVLTDISPSALSSSERDGLLYMVEEEKLARDVYLELYEQWGLRVFSNIAQSEQSHMDSILVLIDRYDLNSPLESDRGVFTDPSLQSLYDELVATGSEDLESAVLVGMTIEDLDIQDLIEHIDESDNDDIRVVYQNLMKGSRNHLRAFARQLDRVGGSYDAQYITEDLYDRILATRNEAGVETDPLAVF